MESNEELRQEEANEAAKSFESLWPAFPSSTVKPAAIMSLAKGLKHGALKEFDVSEKEYLPLIGSFCTNYNTIANVIPSEFDTEQPTETLLGLIRSASIFASHSKAPEWCCVPAEVIANEGQDEPLSLSGLLQNIITIKEEHQKLIGKIREANQREWGQHMSEGLLPLTKVIAELRQSINVAKHETLLTQFAANAHMLADAILAKVEALQRRELRVYKLWLDGVAFEDEDEAMDEGESNGEGSAA